MGSCFHLFELVKLFLVNFYFASLLFLPWWRLLRIHQKIEVISGSTKLLTTYIIGSLLFQSLLFNYIIVDVLNFNTLPIRFNSHSDYAVAPIRQITIGFIFPRAFLFDALDYNFGIHLFVSAEQTLGIGHIPIGIKYVLTDLGIVSSLLVVIVTFFGLLLHIQERSWRADTPSRIIFHQPHFDLIFIRRVAILVWEEISQVIHAVHQFLYSPFFLFYLNRTGILTAVTKAALTVIFANSVSLRLILIEIQARTILRSLMGRTFLEGLQSIDTHLSIFLKQLLLSFQFF